MCSSSIAFFKATDYVKPTEMTTSSSHPSRLFELEKNRAMIRIAAIKHDEHHG